MPITISKGITSIYIPDTFWIEIGKAIKDPINFNDIADSSYSESALNIFLSIRKHLEYSDASEIVIQGFTISPNLLNFKFDLIPTADNIWDSLLIDFEDFSYKEGRCQFNRKIGYGHTSILGGNSP
jgi:hypothetical protein